LGEIAVYLSRKYFFGEGLASCGFVIMCAAVGCHCVATGIAAVAGGGVKFYQNNNLTFFWC